MHVVPHPLVHVPGGAYAVVAHPQFLGLVGRGLQAAAVEHVHVDVAEPFAADVEAEHAAAVGVVNGGEGHLLGCVGQREAVFAEVFDVHVFWLWGYGVMRLCGCLGY